MPNSVLIATDNAAVRAGIRFQLESSGLEVCGEARDGLDALDKAVELKPDLIVLDLAMPRMNGLEAARELKRICPGVPVILHTIYADAVREGQVLPEGVTAVVGGNENLKDRVLHSLQKRDLLVSPDSDIAVCAECGSERQQTLHAELAASFPKLKDLDRGPMYFRQDIRVCLDCGHTELALPPSELRRLQ